MFCPSTMYDVVGLRKMIGSFGTGLPSSTACSLANVYMQKIRNCFISFIHSFYLTQTAWIYTKKQSIFNFIRHILWQHINYINIFSHSPGDSTVPHPPSPQKKNLTNSRLSWVKSNLPWKIQFNPPLTFFLKSSWQVEAIWNLDFWKQKYCETFTILLQKLQLTS